MFKIKSKNEKPSQNYRVLLQSRAPFPFPRISVDSKTLPSPCSERSTKELSPKQSSNLACTFEKIDGEKERKFLSALHRFVELLFRQYREDINETSVNRS